MSIKNTWIETNWAVEMESGRVKITSFSNSPDTFRIQVESNNNWVAGKLTQERLIELRDAINEALSLKHPAERIER